eukprot:68679-Pelagomonas_calceolata.AAC.1
MAAKLKEGVLSVQVRASVIPVLLGVAGPLAPAGMPYQCVGRHGVLMNNCREALPVCWQTWRGCKFLQRSLDSLSAVHASCMFLKGIWLYGKRAPVSSCGLIAHPRSLGAVLLVCWSLWSKPPHFSVSASNIGAKEPPRRLVQENKLQTCLEIANKSESWTMDLGSCNAAGGRCCNTEGAWSRSKGPSFQI